MDFCQRYNHHFIGQGRNSVDHARHYLTGLMGTQRSKNIETFENDVVGSDYQGMEQFISSSPWDHRNLLDDVARDASEAIGDDHETGLFLDETSFLKKGKSSVGVQRQWSGRVGKVENCQVGVFACLGRKDEFALIDFQLYLPESWAKNPEKCAKAKIPENERIYQPKWRQALDLVKRARSNKVKFGWVGADALYGNNHEFLNALEDSGERFMADIHSNHKVWLECPVLEPPSPQRGKRGRPTTKWTLAANDERSLYQRVDRIAQDHFNKDSNEVSFREGAQGSLTGRFYQRAIWTWDEKTSSPPRQRILLIREDESGDLKYSLTNILPGTSLKRLAYIQNQRYWIEHAFHEAKKELGMAQYQVRVWQGWHHHMALICLATVFMAKEKQASKLEHPLLSCRDIVELLDYYLPRRHRDEEELHAQIKKRHAARQQDIDRRKQHKPGLKKDFDLTK
jgi:SRSO17 transposase